jgi:predicted acylesterase/phospholipase RssA
MKHLAIGPGAMTYFAFLGALGALRDCQQLDNLEEISGASAGGLLAFFYVVAEGNIKTILDYSIDIPIKDIMKPNIRQFLKHFGLISQKKIKAVLVDILRVFFSREDLTFREFQNLRPTMPKIHISAYCVNLGRTEYFSCDSTPNMSIVEALCMTIAVPFLFASVEHQGRRYIDGGTMEETPCGIFLGKSDVKVLQTEWKTKTHEYDTRNLKSYIMSILQTTMCLRPKYNYPMINVDMSKFELFDFGVSTETKLRLFSFGYHSTHTQVLKSYKTFDQVEGLQLQEPHIDQLRHKEQCVSVYSPDHPVQIEQSPRDETKTLQMSTHSSSSMQCTVQKTQGNASSKRVDYTPWQSSTIQES